MAGTPSERVARCREKREKRHLAIAQSLRKRTRDRSLMDFPAEAAPSNRQHRLDRIRSRKSCRRSLQFTPAPDGLLATLPFDKLYIEALKGVSASCFGNSIHAQVYPSAYERFKTFIKEGNVYNLACFRVKNSSDKYKPVTNDHVITLSKWTTIEVVEIPPAFPVFTYSLTPIEQLPSRLDYTEYYTDVIGIVTSISNILTLRARGRQNDSLKRVVTIRNERNASVDVVLWGERASSFPAEQMQKDGEASPQVIIFVGTLVKKYSGILTLSGNSPCKWYINPEISEARTLLSSIGDMKQPIKWDQQMTPAKATAAVEEIKISELREVNPFKNKRTEFMVTVAIKKIDNSWWYSACEKCMRAAKTYGNLYKCSAGHIGKPVQRYRITMTAGDETGDTNFIMFGRWVQRLTKKTVDTLIAENPQGFIPNEITRLLEKVFKFNVSFTENTTTSSVLCFQVNAVVGEINDTNAPMAPTGSQSSSLIVSQGASSSMQRTPQKSVSFPVPSQATSSQGTHGSSATPNKTSLTISEQQATPQSRRHAEDQISPGKEVEAHATLLPTQQHAVPINAPVVVAQITPVMSPKTPQDKDDTILPKSAIDVAAGSATKTQKSLTGKRSRSSPNRKIAKKLLLDEDPENEGDDCADDTANPS